MRTSKTLLWAVLCLVSAVPAANAALIVGNTYQDSGGASWIYIGSYNVGDPAAPAWPTSPPNYSAIQAAQIVFGAPPAGSIYATSTSDIMVDHLAWYDGYGSGAHLPPYNFYSTGAGPLAENFFVDVGSFGYTTGGDFSAWIGGDRAAQGGGAINHVFVSVTPEPASMLAWGLIAGVGAAGYRLRKRKAAVVA